MVSASCALLSGTLLHLFALQSELCTDLAEKLFSGRFGDPKPWASPLDLLPRQYIARLEGQPQTVKARWVAVRERALPHKAGALAFR